MSLALPLGLSVQSAAAHDPESAPRSNPLAAPYRTRLLSYYQALLAVPAEQRARLASEWARDDFMDKRIITMDGVQLALADVALMATES